MYWFKTLTDVVEIWKKKMVSFKRKFSNLRYLSSPIKKVQQLKRFKLEKNQDLSLEIKKIQAYFTGFFQFLMLKR